MIKIKKEVIEQIIQHAVSELPFEACGYLASSGDTITRSYALTNIDHSAEHFSFDPAEQFQTLKDARNNSLQIVANYHSHPETPARPSDEDIRLAFDPGLAYFIVSLEKSEPDIKAFRIIDSKVTVEQINIIE
jgi:[CysO sulfur-carrier protein]-S-L-cysteine hydrolase